jgi:hypothetical protein
MGGLLLDYLAAHYHNRPIEDHPVCEIRLLFPRCYVIDPAMPRIARGQQAGFVYHVINRGNGRATIFHKAQDYQAFLSILALTKARHPVQR